MDEIKEFVGDGCVVQQIIECKLVLQHLEKCSFELEI